jgi:L-lactate dehydrogenase complex protein LldG
MERTTSNSREQILHAIRKNKPTESILPIIPPFVSHVDKGELLTTFINMLGRVGAVVAHTSSKESIREAIRTYYAETVHVCSVYPAIEGNVLLENITHPSDLAIVDVAIMQGLLGVAENGAIWLTENQMGHRALPFITQHLVVVISANRLVSNMHEAYKQIAQISEGFGLFISGPSRTADIEQSLVIGAHGARSLLVCLTYD